MTNPPPPDPARVAALAARLIAKGIDESLASQIAADIIILHPRGGDVKVRDGTVIVVSTQ